MHDSFQFIGRRIDDQFRRVALEEAGRKMASGTTIKDMKQRVIQRLLDQGQTAFVDKLGRKWRLDSYAEMVARTTTREAASAATINTCREAGLDLVKITTHYPTCEKCAPLQGKVFSISGEDKRYPKLMDEYRPPIHPNCRHSLHPYVRELDPEADKVQKYSNTSLTKDPRSEEEKQAYKEMRDAVTIATNRKRAREVLLSENAPLEEKMEAYKKLKKTYEDTGKKPVGFDAQVIKHYQLNEDKYNAIIISDTVINDGPQWKSGKDIEHLNKRKKRGHIPENWTLDDYNRKIQELCSKADNEVYLYHKEGFKQKYYVFGDKEWIAIIGQNKVIDTAFKVDRMNYEEYIKKNGMNFLGTVKELRPNGQ
nr:phage minor capsid protein [Carboxydocella sporoproducens]